MEGSHGGSSGVRGGGVSLVAALRTPGDRTAVISPIPSAAHGLSSPTISRNPIAPVHINPPPKIRPKSLQKPPTPIPQSITAARRRALSTAELNNVPSFASPTAASRERSESTTPRRSATAIKRDSASSAADRERPSSSRHPAPDRNANPSTKDARIHRRHASVAVTQTTTTPPTEPQAQALLPNPPNHHSPNLSGALSPRPATSHASSPLASPSPPRKRSPARFSSNGVATSNGPPPSLAYRHNKISMDQRRQYNNSAPNGSMDGNGNRSSTSSSAISAQPVSKTSGTQGVKESQTEAVQMDANTNGYDGYEDEEYDKDRTIRGLEDLRNGDAMDIDGEAGDQGNDDVFLRLASNGSGGRTERRRARLTQQSGQRNSLPPEPLTSPLSQPLGSSPPHVPDDLWRRAAHMSSPGDYSRPDRRMSNASEEPAARTTLSPRPAFPARTNTIIRRDLSPGGHVRSYSMADTLARSRTEPSGGVPIHGLHSLPLDNDSESADQDFPSRTPSRAGRINGNASLNGGGADSTSSVSTTAPSSVWDELDDLKSRIRRLEVTGRMPASGNGGASTSSGDRPRTATTTVTTVSSSPRHNNGASANGISPVNSTFSAANTTNTHPLLHAALGRSKPLIAPEIFKHLEVAAKDALSLASSVGGPGSTTAASERQVRRKVDSMCRSLTELCIALSEYRHDLAPAENKRHSQLQQRPMSRDRASTIGRESVLSGRESMLGDRTRTLGRFAERKQSISSLSFAGGYNSSPGLRELPLPLTNSGTVRHRSSMVMKDHRMSEDELDDRERDRTRSFRAPSRAATEIASHRLSAREYAPSVQSRRHYATNNVSLSSPTLPATSNSRRFFSINQDSEPLRNPVSDRIAAEDEAYSQARLRSGSLGRNQTRRGVPPSSRGGVGLRESVDLGDEGVSLPSSSHSHRLSATERLLARR